MWLGLYATYNESTLMYVYAAGAGEFTFVSTAYQLLLPVFRQALADKVGSNVPIR